MAVYFILLIISNFLIRLSYHLKNYGDRGGCYLPRPQRVCALSDTRTLFLQVTGGYDFPGSNSVSYCF